jgi:predicted  nucleic acid-binding Zn-ribbon protein
VNKLTRLEKSADSTLGTVDKLVQILSSTKEDALKLVSQTEEELVRAKADFEAKWEEIKEKYKSIETRCTYLKKRCLKASTYVDKILSQ